MDFDTIDTFRQSPRHKADRGPAAIVIVEDRVEVASTLAHVRARGFRTVFVFTPPEIAIPTSDDGIQHVIRCKTRAPGVARSAVNAVIARMPGAWLHYCFNAEYLFFPFCEERSVGEMAAFVMEERRHSVLTQVVDLYAGDLAVYPNAVAPDAALLDAAGYYAEARTAPPDGHPLERQLNFYGGPRWRFEEHVPTLRRRIDRVGLFQARPGLLLRDDHTLNDEEMNTYECPWHHSLSAAICSFRAAKALRTNPGSRDAIDDFRWHRSERFEWSSRQLLDLGLMEPGQWF